MVFVFFLTRGLHDLQSPCKMLKSKNNNNHLKKSPLCNFTVVACWRPDLTHAQSRVAKRNVLVLLRKSRAHLARDQTEKQQRERREGSQRPFGWARLDFWGKKTRSLKWLVSTDIYYALRDSCIWSDACFPCLLFLTDGCRWSTWVPSISCDIHYPIWQIL